MAEPLHHNHGVLFVEHTVHADQAVLRTQHPWSAQRLTGAGYYTAYFGKWHVERSNELSRFGWQQQGALSALAKKPSPDHRFNLFFTCKTGDNDTS